MWVAYFMFPNNGMDASVWDFNVSTDAYACDCTCGAESCMYTVWEYALEADFKKKKSLPHRGLVLVLHLDFNQMQTIYLPPPPPNFIYGNFSFTLLYNQSMYNVVN